MIYPINIGSFNAVYDSDTGFIINMKNTKRKKVGDNLGWNHDGYICILFNGKQERAHRIIWYIVYGEWPKNDIDHINGMRNDNRLVNLRDVTRSENMQNIRKCFKSNRHKLQGVSLVNGKYWFSRISVNGKTEHLGSFKTAQEAHNAYIERKKVIHIS